MKNIERIAQHIKLNGAKNMIIHTIPETQNWLVAENFEKDKWLITLCHPTKTVTYNLGTINTKQHIKLWIQLIKAEINTKISQAELAKQYKRIIKNFIRRQQYHANIKKNATTKKEKKKTKQKWIKLC